MGSGSESCETQACALGAWLASIGVHLLTGGGAGVMESVGRGFCSVADRRGLSIGIVPARLDAHSGAYVGPKTGYPNPYVELPVMTHLHQSGNQGTALLSRNHINVLTSSVLVAMPGGAGTSSEVRLAVDVYDRPIVAYLADRSKIPDLPERVPVEPELEGVKAFVLAALKRQREREAESSVDP
jgi:uncharacterized protein (TIGR00725 family)